MTTKLILSLKAGIMAALAMTLLFYLASLVGLPKLAPTEMLSRMLGLPTSIGWVLHLVMGLFWGILYVFVLETRLKFGGPVVKGVVFGLVAFSVAQFGLILIRMYMGAPSPSKSTPLPILLCSIWGHTVYGIVAALVINEHQR